MSAVAGKADIRLGRSPGAGGDRNADLQSLLRSPCSLYCVSGFLPQQSSQSIDGIATTYLHRGGFLVAAISLFLATWLVIE
jgi:hypothetical protein